MNTDERTALASILHGQDELNHAYARMLEGVQLTADRLDNELAEIRDDMLALGNRIESLTQAVVATAKAVQAVSNAQDSAEALHAVQLATGATEPDAIHRMPIALRSVADLEQERGL